jgi:hypothetical protein
MHRCTNSNSKGTAVGAYDASVDIYRDELPGSYLATQLRHSEMNALQEEVSNVIRSTGTALLTDSETPAQMTQLRDAIRRSHPQYCDWRFSGVYSAGLFAKGTCLDSTGKHIIEGDLSRNEATNWVSGGVKPSSLTLVTNTWYPLFAIKKLSTGEVSVGIDNDMGAANLLAESTYNLYRRIGYLFYKNSSGVKLMSITGDGSERIRLLIPTSSSFTEYPYTSATAQAGNNTKQLALLVPTWSTIPMSLYASVHLEVTNNYSVGRVIQIADYFNCLDGEIQDGMARVYVAPSGGKAFWEGIVSVNTYGRIYVVNASGGMSDSIDYKARVTGLIDPKIIV